MIYLDSAATSYYRPESVANAVYQAIHSMGNPERSSHGSSLEASRVVYETRNMLAELFHAKGASQVAFTSNITEALNIVIQGYSKMKKSMAATQMDHNSILRPLYQAKQEGCRVEIVPVDKNGNLDMDKLETILKSGIDVFLCTHASNLTGNKNDIHMIGWLCKKYGTTFVLDTAQTAGIFPIDMQEDCIDIVCFTGHKGLMGPQGVGGLCLAEHIVLPSWKVGGTGIRSYEMEHPSQMPTALEAGTLNGHGIAGLHAALLYIKDFGIDAIQKKEQKLMKQFYEGVKNLSGITIYGDFSNWNRAAIVALNIREYDSSQVSDTLAWKYNIYTRGGAHCAPLMHTALGTKEQGAVRFSFSHFLEEHQVEEAIGVVEHITKEFL